MKESDAPFAVQQKPEEPQEPQAAPHQVGSPQGAPPQAGRLSAAMLPPASPPADRGPGREGTPVPSTDAPTTDRGGSLPQISSNHGESASWKGERGSFIETPVPLARTGDTLLSLPAPSDPSELGVEDRLHQCEVRLRDVEAELAEVRRDQEQSREGRSLRVWAPWLVVLLLLVVVGQMMVRLSPR